MSSGVAASDSELAEAFFKQACFDLKNGRRLIDLELDGGKALAVAQFQQCCEKALKAVMLVEAGRNLYGQIIKPSHKIWSKDLAVDKRLTQYRRKVEKAIGLKACPKLGVILSKLEGYAPRMTWENANTEYPWVDISGRVISPAEYFEERAAEVSNFSIYSRSLLKQVKSYYNPRFNEVWLLVEQIED